MVSPHLENYILGFVHRVESYTSHTANSTRPTKRVTIRLFQQPPQLWQSTAKPSHKAKAQAAKPA